MTREPDAGLTDLERDILVLENQWWKNAGSKDARIREQLDLTPTRYYQILSALIDKPAALAADPMLVKRLRRVRDEARARRQHPAGRR